jgi:hypothetical protein
MSSDLTTEQPSSAPTDEVVEPTLDVVLKRSALAELPERMALLMQLAWPLAAHFTWLGWYMPATGAVAAGAIGAWAWCERQLRAEEPANESVIRVARGASGLVAAGATVAFLMEIAFVLMGNRPIS